MGMRIRSLGPVLLLSLGGTLTACSTSATPVTHHVVEDVGVRGDAAVCDPFNQVAGSLEHSDNQVLALDRQVAGIASNSSDVAFRSLGEELATQIQGLGEKPDLTAATAIDVLVPAQNPTLRQIGAICVTKGLIPSYMYEET